MTSCKYLFKKKKKVKTPV